LTGPRLFSTSQNKGAVVNDILMTPELLESERRSRLAAEAALRLVSERLEKAEEAAGALIYDWDIVAQKIWRSAGLTRVLGWQIDEVAPNAEGASLPSGGQATA
jgi:hypothetical protein